MNPSDLFQRLAARYGIPASYLDGAWAVESDRGKNLYNKATGAAGPFQFEPRVAAAYKLADPMNFEQSADAAARLAADNAKRLAKIGVAITPGNLYLVHQQGFRGASALLQNANKPALDVLASIYGNMDHARRALELNGGKPGWTAGEFANHIASNFYAKAGTQGPPPVNPQTPSPRTQPEPSQGGGFTIPNVHELAGMARDKWSELLESLGGTPPIAPGPVPTPVDQALPTSGWGDILASIIK